MRRWSWGAVEVTRVDDPGFELLLPQPPAATEVLAARPWLRPAWVTEDLALRVGSSAIAVRTPSAVVVVDPWLAFDDPARLAPRLSALRAAGIDPAEVDLVVNSHIDGAGANVQADGTPTFPNARYLLPRAEVDLLREGRHPEQLGGGRPDPHPMCALDAHGVLEGLAGGEQLVPGVLVEDAPGHGPGHVVVWVSSGGGSAVVVGHLFLHPAQVADPSVANGDLDTVALEATRRSVLRRCEEEGALLVGPLFADPGAGRVRADGDGWALEPDAEAAAPA